MIVHSVYIKTLIANHEAHLENKFIGPSVSMYKDSVITTWASQAIGSLNLKVLGCHAKNIYTEEVSKVPSHYFDEKSYIWLILLF